MKQLLVIFIIALSSCGGAKEKETSKQTNADTSQIISPQTQPQSETVWQGTLNNKIPVLLYYSVQNGDVAGKIIYLNTLAKKPINICGNIKDDNSYDLYEYENNGNVTGTITCKITDQTLTGSWYAGRSGKEYKLNLSKKDTVINTPASATDISGHYRYQYGEDGYQGDMDVKKLGNSKVEFSISSVTGEPARNLADVSKDTIEMAGNSFIYKVPESDSCEFKVTFYRTFLKIDYTKGPCDSQFDFNATVEGVYFKVQK